MEDLLDLLDGVSPLDGVDRVLGSRAAAGDYSGEKYHSAARELHAGIIHLR
ncbi:MAG TPA: hypothetical protein VKR79_09465 [Gaiellaceae bacterium]|nr:hypothetical protein [Gaiellaceae bacterium]